jgi:hypothetical protein
MGNAYMRCRARCVGNRTGVEDQQQTTCCHLCTNDCVFEDVCNQFVYKDGPQAIARARDTGTASIPCPEAFCNEAFSLPVFRLLR